MHQMRDVLLEKTGFRIDIPSCHGGASSTGNVARSCFLKEKYFIKWATPRILPEDQSSLAGIRKNLSVILSLYHSNSKIDTLKIDRFCKETYQIIALTYPWVSITPPLRKLLAHSAKLIANYNNGSELKIFCEEFIESLNKYIRRYRERLSRKFNFDDNTKNILYG